MENNNVDINKINAQIKKDSEFIDLLLIEINKVIVGQKYMLERLLIGLLGNCLLYTSPSPRDTERSRMPSSA